MPDARRMAWRDGSTFVWDPPVHDHCTITLPYFVCHHNAVLVTLRLYFSKACRRLYFYSNHSRSLPAVLTEEYIRATHPHCICDKSIPPSIRNALVRPDTFLSFASGFLRRYQYHLVLYQATPTHSLQAWTEASEHSCPRIPPHHLCPPSVLGTSERKCYHLSYAQLS